MHSGSGTKEEWNILKSQIATSKTPEDEVIIFLRSQIATTKDLAQKLRARWNLPATWCAYHYLLVW